MQFGRVAIAGGSLMVDIAHQVQDVRQLHRAFNLRVTGEDLLDERRARAWQSHNENRRDSGDGRSRVTLEKRRIKKHLNRSAAPFKRVGIEGGFPTALGITSGIVGKGRVVLVALLVRFA